MKITKTMAALATTGALGLIAVPVLAQDASDPPGDSTTDSPTDSGDDASEDVDGPDVTEDLATEDTSRRGRHGFGLGGGATRSEDFAQELADELGVDLDQVTDALEAIRERRAEEFAAEHADRLAELQTRLREQLDEAVEEGAVTQEQADLLIDLWDARQDDPDGFTPEDLTDEQREALSAFRSAVGDRLGGGSHHARRGLGGFGHGGDDADEDATEAPDDEATIQESALLTA